MTDRQTREVNIRVAKAERSRTNDHKDCVLENVDGDLVVCETTRDWNSTVVTESVPVCVVSGHPAEPV